MTSRRLTALAICLALLSFFTFGCIGDWFGDDEPPTAADEAYHDAVRQEMVAEEADSAERAAEAANAPEGSDYILKITLAGENLPFHTAALYNTLFYLDRNAKTCTANNSTPFEEPSGTDLTRRGTDSVTFDGTYDIVEERVTGTLTIQTSGSATGGHVTSDNDLVYAFTGEMTLERADSVSPDWTGTVTGTSTLTQTWTGMPGQQPDVTSNAVNWTVTSSHFQDIE